MALMLDEEMDENVTTIKVIASGCLRSLPPDRPFRKREKFFRKGACFFGSLALKISLRGR